MGNEIKNILCNPNYKVGGETGMRSVMRQVGWEGLFLQYLDRSIDGYSNYAISEMTGEILYVIEVIMSAVSPE